MTAQQVRPTIVADGDYWRVICPAHSLHRTVATQKHAQNILALHERIDHPHDDEQAEPLDLTRAAAWLLLVHDDPDMGESHRTVAMTLWTELLGGMGRRSALDFAREVVDANPPLTAHIAPF